MQKALSATASFGAIILFVSAAASASATLAILGVYGIGFFHIGFPIMLILVSKKKRIGRLKIPLAMRWALVLPAFLIPIVGLASLFIPELAAEWSLTSFGVAQFYGVLGLILTLEVGLIAAWELRDGSRQTCPFCLSSIPREAIRCRYCTSSLPGNSRGIDHPPTSEKGFGEERQSWLPSALGRRRPNSSQLRPSSSSRTLVRRHER
jgi:hypothetical protein